MNYFLLRLLREIRNYYLHCLGEKKTKKRLWSYKYFNHFYVRAHNDNNVCCPLSAHFANNSSRMWSTGQIPLPGNRAVFPEAFPDSPPLLTCVNFNIFAQRTSAILLWIPALFPSSSSAPLQITHKNQSDQFWINDICLKLFNVLKAALLSYTTVF